MTHFDKQTSKQHLEECMFRENYNNDKTNLSKFDYEILKIDKELNKIPRAVIKVVSYLQEASFSVVRNLSQFSEVLALSFI